MLATPRKSANIINRNDHQTIGTSTTTATTTAAAVIPKRINHYYESPTLKFIEHEKQHFEQRLRLLRSGRIMTLSSLNGTNNTSGSIKRVLSSSSLTTSARFNNLTKFSAMDGKVADFNSKSQASLISSKLKVNLKSKSQASLTSESTATLGRGAASEEFVSNNHRRRPSNAASITRRKSSVFQDIYEIKHLKDDGGAYVKSKGFSKTHLFDVYLDEEEAPLPRKERLPSIVDLYKNAFKLNLIDKFNPTTVRSFKTLMKDMDPKKSTKNPTYDVKSKSLQFDGVKVKKSSQKQKTPSTSPTTGYRIELLRKSK